MTLVDIALRWPAPAIAVTTLIGFTCDVWLIAIGGRVPGIGLALIHAVIALYGLYLLALCRADRMHPTRECDCVVCR